MSADQPHFRFNPNAYAKERCFERSGETCDVCSRPCVWRYTGTVYTKTSPTVCARCIAAGNLAAFLKDEHFVLHDIELCGAEPKLEVELLQRTPGVSCWNPFQWPVLDATPLAFLGYGEDQHLIKKTEVQSAIETAYAEVGCEDEPTAPSPYLLIFKEVEGERYRVAIDLD